MSNNSNISSDDSEYSDDEIVTSKVRKNVLFSDSSDEENMFQSTTKKNQSVRDSATSSSVHDGDGDKNSGSSSMLGTDKTVLSNDKEVSNYKNRLSFMTPQTKKLQIQNSDSDSDSDSDVVNTSLILDDSFDEAADGVTSNENTQSVISIDSDSEDPNNKQEINIKPEISIKPSIDTKVQTKLDDLFKKLTPSKLASVEPKIKCKRSEYNEQLQMIRSKEHQMLKAKNLLTTVNISNLPDKGQLLKKRFEETKTDFLEAQDRLRNMIVDEEDLSEKTVDTKKGLFSNWSDLEAGLAVVQPKTFGKKGLENYQTQKALTVESLEELHGSLKNCPKEDQLADQPKGLKVSLMDHQRRALAWMAYREQQKPSGGILADDMGLGKTLTMISLVLKMKEHKVEHEESDEEQEMQSKRHKKYNGGTLVICPASLLNQWAQEIDNKLKRGLLSYDVYHGPKREVKPKRLAENDMVITTYSIAMNEKDKEGAIFRVRWNRIILDEAHQIRNHKARTSIACCSLSGKYRWALTGTPVHNKELDMYALLKFLRCSPFDDLAVWKRWVGDKGSGGGERLNTVISSLMLRRTKAELITQGKLMDMPSRKWELITVTLDESEMSLYQKILLFSQTLFAQFLHQKAERDQDIVDIRNRGNDPNKEYFKMRKKLLALNQMREVNQHEILVLLLRLRQICCHPSLITDMLQGDEDLGEEEPEDMEEINLLEQLNNLNLEDQSDITDISQDTVAFKEATKGILNPSHPLFAKERISSKIAAALNLLPNILSSGDKVIIVSQWTKFLDLVGWQLKAKEIKFTKLDGSVPTSKRTEIVNNFNDPNSRVKVLLLSLTAGGVGLNLVGANHLFLLDLHWNPQLENQAQDRIYRMGQKKSVYVYKFMAGESIEERIKQLQENKIEISESMLTGSKRAMGSKLSLQDLKLLFNM